MVTLAVIGIIASFVVSRIKLKMQEITTVAKVKNVYSLLNSSFDYSVKKYGSPDKWRLNNGVRDENGEGVLNENSLNFTRRILAGIKVEDISDKNLRYETNYLNNANRTIMANDNFTIQPYFVLPGGVVFMHGWVSSKTCSHGSSSDNMFLKGNICGDFRVDINGQEKPNIIGIDQFQFYVTKKGIVPMGYAGDTRPIETLCNPKGEPVKLNGYSCASWVLEKGTMPWLYGKQVKWD